MPFYHSASETPLAERVRVELAALFPKRDESQLEIEIVNELKRSVKGYRKCASLDDWLANAYFEYHAGLYKNRPIYWHIASAQGTSPFAFGALVHYHRFDKNRMQKLRASYVRDTIEELRRDAGLADKAGRADDRVELQAKLEEVQARGAVVAHRAEDAAVGREVQRRDQALANLQAALGFATGDIPENKLPALVAGRGDVRAIGAECQREHAQAMGPQFAALCAAGYIP